MGRGRPETDEKDVPDDEKNGGTCCGVKVEGHDASSSLASQ